MAPPEVVDLSVVIVNYNVREFLEQALRSVQRAAAGLSVEIFVVDNNSVDGSVEMVRERFPEVRLIANEENVGFSRANNQAIRAARGRYLLILNPDTIVREDTLTTLVRFMEAHPEAGAVGCKILNPDGTFALESRRAFPTPPVALFRMIGLSRLFPRSRVFGRYNLTYLPIDEVAEVDALSGSCMLVRHAALYQACAAPCAAGGGGDGAAEPPGPGAGLFDESFFMYGEDLDWCFRIQQAGWSIYYTPETQIIHYKGESTKKGELRYVRLFYGAMIRFAEKHLDDRSGLFLVLLRLGVVARAALMVAGNAVRRLAVPLLEFALVWATVAGLGGLRSAQTGIDFSALFYGLVGPVYALFTVVAIAAVGGYRPVRRHRVRPAWAGAALALLAMAALSFFVRELAFSRVVVGAAFPAIAAVLTARRLVLRTRRSGLRRALFVGPAEEARRLRRMLAGHPHPPFELVGYVADAREGAAPETLPRLGTLRHLRDLVRLRRIDDVVFAADGLANETIFRLMQRLRDLPVQSRILAAGREHVIGKASVADLSTPTLIEAEAALGAGRSRAARRAFELLVACVGLLVHPFAAGVARLGGRRSRAARLVARTRQLPAVLAGRRALVGRRADEPFAPPPEWDLRPAVFAVPETLAVPDPTPEEIRQAYWFYVRNQSAFLDWTLMLRVLR
ncbi:MAG: glycosyltransferase [Rhodothermales bacterium]|nr:glycosyltransferase [Rhodothermales bacterium]